MTSEPSTVIGRRRLRRATCSTARFSVVLILSPEHPVTPALHIHGSGQFEQELHGVRP